MYSSDQLNSLLKEAASLLGAPENEKNNKNCNKPKITPSQILVIAGILGGVLDVDSILIDKRQEIQIVLLGTLKRPTELEQIMQQIGSLPFDQVVKAMLGGMRY